MQIIRFDYNWLHVRCWCRQLVLFPFNILVDLFTIYNLVNLWRHNPLLEASFHMHYSWCQHKKAVGNFCSLSNCLPIIVELCSFFIATFIACRHLKIIFTNMSTMGLIYHPYVASLFIHRPTSITLVIFMRDLFQYRNIENHLFRRNCERALLSRR